MLVAIVIAAVGSGLVLLGAKGFTAAGIPWSDGRTLTGRAGRIVGTICIALGTPIAMAGFALMAMIAGRK